MSVKNRPKRGSQAYRDYVRHSGILPRGCRAEFIAFKAASASLDLSYVKNNPDSKKEPFILRKYTHVTVFEVPPLMIEGINLYKNNKKVSFIGSESSSSVAHRTKNNSLRVPSDKYSLLVSYSPSGINALESKKKVFFELPPQVLNSKSENLIQELGKKINLEIPLKYNFFDAIGVTKGKGFSGVVKRYGVRLLAKGSKKKRRAIANQGGKSPGWTHPNVGAAGQLGFQKRTSFNLQNMGSFPQVELEGVDLRGYGRISPESRILVIKGPVPGPLKRPICFRKAERAHSKVGYRDFKFHGIVLGK